MPKSMRNYEMIAVLSPKKQSQKCLEALDNLFKRHGAQTRKEEKWGEKRIMHPQEKDIKKAFYVYRSCRMEAKKVKEFTKDIQLDSHIFRFMLKRVD